MENTIKNHWETVYNTKSANEVSWTQDTPAVSLDFIHSFNLPKSAKIIDVGGIQPTKSRKLAANIRIRLHSNLQQYR